MSTTTTNLGLIKPELTDNVSITDINENMDKIDVATSENTNKIETGWIPLTGTFTYSNSTTITTSADCTSFLSAGMKLKCTNSTVKMSVIKSVTSTIIVLETAVLASGTITGVYFSTGQVPYGYSAGDFIVESGTIGVWVYEKWKSGRLVAKNLSVISADLTKTYSGNERYYEVSITPPNLFLTIVFPKVFVSSTQGTPLYAQPRVYNTSSITVWVVGTTQETRSVNLFTEIEGTWK